MQVAQILSALTKRKLVDGVDAQNVRAIQGRTASVVARGRERRGSRKVVDMLGEGIGEHIGKPVAESLLALQLQRVVIGVANIVVHRDRSISRERPVPLQIGMGSP